MHFDKLLLIILEVQVMCFARVNGIFISGDLATDIDECAVACNDVEACKWFTFNSEDQSCVLTGDREFISDCPSCAYGHEGCLRQGTSGMVMSLASCSSSLLFLRNFCFSTPLKEVVE